MPSVAAARAELEALRASLMKPFQAARARGDQAEMDRLTTLAGEIDDALDDLAILGLAAVAAKLEDLSAAVEAAHQRAKSFPFGAFDTSPLVSSPAAADGAALDQERPSRSLLGEAIDDRLAADEEPHFVTLAEVRHSFRGSRPKGIEGAIIHYDAGRSRPTKGADDPEWGAKNSLAWGQKQGFAYATISRSGKIYLPGNMDWEKWGSHAGASVCPATGRSAVSQFYVGFEVNCPGLVYPTDEANVFVPWFDAARDGDGAVILNKKGHATVANKNGELYKKSEVRIVTKLTGNIRPGAYVPYTDAQFKAVVNVLLWLKRNFKKTFRLDFAFGHDEVSPRRKVDPGGSLGRPKSTAPGAPTTMGELRAELLKTWADQQALVS